MNSSAPHAFHTGKKAALILLALLGLFSLKSRAQGAEITGIAGYTLAETFSTTDAYEVRISDGFTYGGNLSFNPNEFFSIILQYTRQDATADVYDYLTSAYKNDIPVSVNNIMIGGERNQPLGEKAYGFGGLNLGTAGLVTSESGYSDRWKFAFDIHAGFKIYPSDRIGIRLQAGINFPVQYFGAAFTVGTGGSGAGVTASSTITQVNFLGGLIIRFPSR
jgi:hypothetical protein